ncbi:MAG TPA: RpiB/LacA/LacB family sugar-phosphate isomerase, partial [Candidatus Methylomirabilis sp.]|nr:RpiB/LacA/LacB family sugar-phosphate isomerase [Candidatus Methylomirabilis sp.]
MRIAFGCDDVGFPLKAPLISALESDGHVVLDLGSFSSDPVDYPDYVRVVGQAVLRGFADAGVLVCGSGVGASIAANKLRSVRAAFCPDPITARESREQQDANVLCLSATALDERQAIDIAKAWVDAAFSAAEPHARRVAKIAQLEDSLAQDKDRSNPRPRESQVELATPPARPAAAAEPPLPPRTPVKGPINGGAAAPPGPARAGEAPSAERAPAATPPPAPRRPRSTRDALRLPLVEDALRVLESQGFLDRLWTKDAGVWKGDPALIKNRLGWLTAPTIMRAHTDELRQFADEIRRLQFSQVVVLGMGAVSLSTELFCQTFGSKMGFPDLLTLDCTDPAAVRHVMEHINLPRSLFVLASKSGTTAETLAFYTFFRERIEAATAAKPGMQFVALTDPGTPLDAMARESGFRHTFLNPPSIGGRYSVLSFFGLLPAALIGVDIKTVIERARGMVEQCGNTSGSTDSPAVRLGAALAGLAKAGRDKVTFVLSEKIRALGPWLEQLLAESLGKDGKGLVPVVDEPLGNPVVYGSDRVFVALTLEGDVAHDAALDALAEAGHAVIRIELRDALDLGAEFFRWQVATVTAGAILGVNPFDEPDVARAKDNAAQLLSQWRKTRRLPEWGIDAEEEGIALISKSIAKTGSVAEGLTAHLGQAQPGDYLAIQAYLEPSAEIRNRLQALRTLLRD